MLSLYARLHRRRIDVRDPSQLGATWRKQISRIVGSADSCVQCKISTNLIRHVHHSGVCMGNAESAAVVAGNVSNDLARFDSVVYYDQRGMCVRSEQATDPGGYTLDAFVGAGSTQI